MLALEKRVDKKKLKLIVATVYESKKTKIRVGLEKVNTLPY